MNAQQKAGFEAFFENEEQKKRFARDLAHSGAVTGYKRAVFSDRFYSGLSWFGYGLFVGFVLGVLVATMLHK